MLPQIVPQLLETLTGRAIPAHRANDHEMGTQMRAPTLPVALPARHQEEPFREPTWTGVRRQPATPGRYFGWSSAQ